VPTAGSGRGGIRPGARGGGEPRAPSLTHFVLPVHVPGHLMRQGHAAVEETQPAPRRLRGALGGSIARRRGPRFLRAGRLQPEGGWGLRCHNGEHQGWRPPAKARKNRAEGGGAGEPGGPSGSAARRPGGSRGWCPLRAGRGAHAAAEARARPCTTLSSRSPAAAAARPGAAQETEPRGAAAAAWPHAPRSPDGDGSPTSRAPAPSRRPPVPSAAARASTPPARPPPASDCATRGRRGTEHAQRPPDGTPAAGRARRGGAS
jgi:hypothetical protein